MKIHEVIEELLKGNLTVKGQKEAGRELLKHFTEEKEVEEG